jgi:hypothetical protein
MELIEWLREQLDADERIALAVEAKRPGPWEVDGVAIISATRKAEKGWDYDVFNDIWNDEAAALVVAWDPARVLAEVKAKRAILDGYEASYRQSDDYPGWEGAMYAIAQVFTGREGWQPEWSAR